MHDVVAELQVGLKDLAAEDRSGWSSLARSDRFRDVQGLAERVEVERIRTVAQWDRFTDWADDGAVTAVSWVRHHLQVPQAEAALLVRLARHYDQHRPVRDALDGGEISLAKVKLLARAERGHEELFAACVDGLVGHARELDLEDFTAVLVEWVELADEGSAGDDDKRRWRKSASSGIGRGILDGSEEDLNVVQAAIDALDTLDPPDCPEGPRSREQRHYDIVIDIFRRALADELGDDPAATSNVDIVVDAEVAAELVRAPFEEKDELFDGDPLPEALRPFRDGEADRLLRRCQHPDGTRARRVVAEAMLCFSFIRKILIDPTTGAPLDVGRAHRRFTPRQVRALVVRDGGCVFPGCDRRPKWCDAHHLRPWEDDGPTDLDNGCLLCRRHHVLVHNGWTLRRDRVTGVFTATSPTGREYLRDPRRPCERR